MKKQLLTKLGQQNAKSRSLSFLFFISLLFSITFFQQVQAQDAFITNKGVTTICEGESTTLQVLIAASVGPYTVVYSDGTSDFTINNYASDGDPESVGYGGDPINISPIVTTTYSLVSVHDAFSTLLPISAATTVITVNPLPTALSIAVNAGSPICYGTNFTISASATNGSIYELWNEANTVKSGDLPFVANITANTNYTVRAISSFGCTISQALTINLENSVPTISTPVSQTLNPLAGTCATTIPDYTSLVTVSDNCSIVGNIVLTQDPVIGTAISGNGTVQTITITATDEAGNFNSSNFNVTLIDNILPEITCVGNQPVAANSGCSYIHSGTAWDTVGTDNCTGASTVYVLAGATTGTGTSLNGVTFLPGNTTVTWTVTDGNSNIATCSFDVSISDSENPTVSCVADKIVNTTTGFCTYTHSGTLWNVTAADNCGVPTISYGLTGATTATVAMSLDGAIFNKGLTTVTATVTDGALNTATCSFTVTINDTENPTIVNLPVNIAVNNDASSCGAIVSWAEPTAADNCTGQSIAQTLGLVSGSLFPIGISTITYKATDASLNTLENSFTITVTDNELPIISCPSNISQNIDANVCGAVVTYTAPIGTDNCVGANTLQIAGLASGVTFPVGVTTNTFEVTDASGNSASCSFTVTITDNENPTIVNLPINISVNNDNNMCGAVVSWVEPTSADNCSGSSILQTVGLANGSIFPVGISTITYTVTDANLNTFENSFTITVSDNQIPVITGCPANITKSSDNGVCTAIVSWTEPAATDNCTLEGNLVWTKSHEPGDLFSSGTTTVTYTATDIALNISATCSFDVIVVDNQKPVISSCPTNISQGVDAGQCDAVVNWVEPTATDNCTFEGSLTWIKSHNPGDTFPVGTTTVTYTTTDEVGNISNPCVFDVVVLDDIAPIALCKPVTINLNASGVATLTVSDVNNLSSDNCTAQESLIITLSKTSFNCADKGDNIVVMTVKDAAGNTNTCNATVTVADNISPILTSTLDTVTSNVNQDPGLCYYLVKGSEFDPSVSDNCSGIVLSYTVSGATILSGTTTLAGENLLSGANIITWIASDGTNTSTPLTFTKTVLDNQAPIISSIGNQSRNTTSGCGYAVVGTEFDATYSDNCTITSVTYTINSNTPVEAVSLADVIIPQGINTIVWTVSDGTNTRTSTYRVTVTDNISPTISAISDITTNISTGCDAVVSWTEPTPNDNCGVSIFGQVTGLVSGSAFPVGTTLIRYRAIDAVGNTTFMSFNVIVNDLTPPVLACPEISLGVPSTLGSPFIKPAAAGICFYTVSGTEFDPTTDDGCLVNAATNSFDGTTTLEGKEIPVGLHTIVWTATDDSNNASTCTIYLRVDDLQDPTFTQPTGEPALSYSYDRTTDPGECFYTIPDTVFDLRNVADNCSTQTPTYIITKNGVTEFTGSNTIAGLQLSKDTAFPYSIIWTVVDVNGNSVSSIPYTISVADNQAPTFTCYGNEIRNIPIDECTYVISGTEFDPLNLSDNCDAMGSLVVSYTLNGISGGLSTTLANEILAPGTHTVIWSVTDLSSNTETCTFDITIIDPLFPVISTITNQTRNAPSNVCYYEAIGTEFDPSVTDNCPGVVLVNNQNNTSTLASFQFPVGITVVVWSATDAGGNVSTLEYQVNVQDVTAPAYSLITSITKSTSATSCYYTTVGTEFDPQSISDNCTNSNYTILNNYNNYRSLAFVEFPVGTTNVQWSVKDNYGNETLKTIAITVVDDVNPVISCPGSSYTRVYDDGFNYYTVGIDEFKPVVSDNCALTSYINNFNATSSLNGEQLTEGPYTITWTATDTAGNVTTCDVIVNVVSDLYPAITCVGDQSKSTNVVCDYVSLGTEIDATSTSAGATLINDFNSLASLAGAVFPKGTTLVTWTASQTIDGTLYTNNCSYYVFVTDNEDPVITPPANILTTTNSGCYATGVALGTPTTSDNCGVSSFSNDAPSRYPIGVTNVTWSVSDVNKNTSTVIQTVTVADTTIPSISCPVSLCRQVDEGQTYYTVFDHEFNPYDVWDCSGILSVINDFNGTSTLVGEQFLLGDTVVNWSIIDNAGNEAICSITITINSADPPSVTCRGNQTKSTDINTCTYTIQGVEFDVTSTTPGTTLTYTLSGVTVDASGIGTTLNGVVFNKGTTTVNWVSDDGLGNTNICCSFTVTVNDNQNPVITWPIDITVNVDAASCTAANVNLGTPTATDNCDAPIDIVFTRNPSSNSFDSGSTNVYWETKDANNNYVYHTQVVTVIDNIDPVINCPTSTYFREYKNSSVIYYEVIGSEFTPTASDNCKVSSYTNNLTGTRYLNSTQLLIGNNPITWTAIDPTGNTDTCIVNVTVVDSFVPIIECPVDVTLNTSVGACGFTVGTGITTYDAIFTSVSGSGRTLTHDLAGAPSNTTLEGATIPKGATTITWTASQTIDGTVYNNTCSFNFTVVDLTPPVLDVPFDNVTVNVDSGTCTNTMTLTAPTATDNCTIPANITITNDAPVTFLLGTTNVRWVLTDESNNTTIYIQTVTVYDNEAPIITNCPVADLTAEASGNTCQSVVSWPALSATDACSGMKSFVSTHSPGSLFSVGTTTVTYTATDNNDNVSTCTFNVIVTDAPPTIACITNKTRVTDSGTCSYIVLGNEFDPTSFSDNCTNPTITWSFINPNTLLEVTGNNTLSGISIPRGSIGSGVITITWTATDSGGQTAACSFDLTIQDNEAPILVVPGNQTRSTDVNQNYYTVLGTEFDDVTAADNCGIVTKVVNEFGVTTLAGRQLILGENSITWEATDDSGNVSQAAFFAYVVDTELPRLQTAPQNITINTLSGCSAAVSYTPPVIIDNVTLDGDLITTVSPSYATPGYVFPVGVTPVTYLVLDEAGNSFSYTFDITVIDNIPPSITCAAGSPGNEFHRNTDVSEAFYTALGTEFDPTDYLDNCSVTIENDYNNLTTLVDETFPMGTTIVIWIATDDSGNTATCTVQIIITDVEPPTITNCPNVTAVKIAEASQCYYLIPGSEYDPYNFADNDGVQKLTYSINGAAEVGTDLSTTLVGQQIPVGTTATPTTTVVWRLYDLSGNISSTCTTEFTVTDPEPPTVLTVANQTRNTDSGVNTYTATNPADILWNPTVTDNCTVETITYQIDGGAIIGTDLSTSIIGESFTVGTHTVVWTGTDIYGNTNTGSYLVIIQDNEAPTVVCNPLTVQLNAAGNYTLTVDNIAAIGLGSADPSGIASLAVSPTIFDCIDVGDNTVTLTVTDNFGNAATCDAIVTVEDTTAPTAICKPLTVALDALGNATILASQINNGSNDACGISSISASKTVFDCTNVGVNTVTLTVTDNNGNTSTCDATVTITDDVNPVAVCKNITVNLDAFGNATIVGTDVDNGSYDNCLSSLVYTAIPNTFNCTNIGANSVVLTVTDPAGNSDTCNAIVTIVDTVQPTAICQDITIQLDASGNAVINAAQIDNGSSDACGIASATINKTDFDCSNLGSNPVTNTVTLTVTDNNSNVSTCTAVVTVEDSTNPIISCTTNQTVNTDTNVCTYTHSGITWDATATDTCTTIAGLTYALSGDTILADNLANTSLDSQLFNKGITTITWTAIDGSGNSSTCSYTITVNDNQVPTPVCQNIAIQLDASGNASIVAEDINNGSFDNCGIQSILASTTAFTCVNLGANTVTLTVTDLSGNTATCEATVTVQDFIPPVAACKDITVQLDAAGNVTILGSDVDNTSTDNCSIASYLVSKDDITYTPSVTYNCGDVSSTKTLYHKVTDVAGNTSTACTSTITIEDNVNPNVVCQNITVQLDGSGNYTLTAAEIDNGSSDACGILSLSASKTAFTCADLGVNIVTLTVTDNNGNISNCNSTVTVQDTVKPIFTFCETNQIVTTDTNVCTYTHPNDTWNLTALDNCAVSTLTYNLTGVTSGTGTTLNGEVFNNGVTTVTWTATDASGNSETCVYTVTVNDEQNPNAICQAFTANLDRNGQLVVNPSDIDNASNDACGIILYEISKDNSTFTPTITYNCGEIGTPTAYLKVTDAAGNSSTCSTTITVQDTQAPTLNDLTDRNEVTDNTFCTYTHLDNLWNPWDNCDLSPTITYTVSGVTTVVTGLNTTLNGQIFNQGTTIVTWTTLDTYGNGTTINFNVVVTDNQNPTITCPANITQDVASGGDTLVTVAAIAAPTYGDNCSVTKLTYEFSGATIATAQVSGINELSSDVFNLGTTTVDYIAYDAAGNSETCSFTITINALPNNTVVVSPTVIVTDEDIATDTFTVVLPSAPTGDVIFNVVSSDLTEGTVSTSTLTFNAGNWNIPQTVTVTGVNDDVDDGDIPYTILLTTNQTLTDPLSGYYNVEPADVSATNLDNDVAGVTVSTISNATSEDGNTATFTVVLDTEPTDNVTITLTSDDTTESDTFSPITLTFTPANWSNVQTVTVTGKDDEIVDGNVGYNIVTSAATSTDPNYNTMVVDDVAVVNNDNDTAGFIVTPLTLNTTEAGGTATFTVVLTSKPATDAINYVVVVDVASNDLTEGTVDLAQLTFDHTDWNVPQTITVTGADEILVDGDIVYTILNTVNVGLTTDANYDPLNPDDVSVTNADDDAAFVSINSFSQLETDSGTTNFIFTVTHSGAEVVGGYSVSFFTQSGVAKSPTDFTGAGGSVNFTTGAIGETQTITIVVNGDTMVESNETFNVVLNSVNAPGKNITIIPAGKTGVGTITNDDNATLSIANETIVEEDSGTQTLTFTVTLDMDVEDGLTIDYTTVDNTATTADLDYGASSGTLTFTGTAGETKIINVTINGDQKVELDETFFVNLSNIVPVSAPGAAITFADASAIGTITNDDAAVISITGVTVNEDAGTADFTITMDKSVQTAFTIDFATSNNTALSGSDYTAVTSILNFGGANALTQTVTIPITNDSFVEPSEDLFGTISNKIDGASQNVTFFGGGASTQATITINDNDVATIAINNVSVNEAVGTATFTVTLTGDIQDDLTVDYTTVNIDALSGSDYTLASGTVTFVGGSTGTTTQPIVVTILNDVIAEPTETYTIDLSAISSTGTASFTDNQGLGTITDNDPLQLDIAGFSITETEATQTANFVITSDIASQEDIIITFTTTDISTTSGSDLTAQTTQPYTLTAGATTWNIPVDILGDLIAEPTETFTGTFALSNVNGQDISIGTASDTSTILDNDAVVIDLAGFTITETDGTQSQNFVASTNIAAEYDIVLSFSTANGNALDGNDYTAQAATVVTILAGTTSVNIPVDILGDLITEPQEAFTATIAITNANAQQVSIGTGTDTVTINDNDPAIITIAGFSVNEAAGTADYTITLNRVVQNAFTVDFATSNITALAGSDYTAVGTTTLNFGAANPLVQTVTVTINDDDLVEPSETLVGTLSNLVANSQDVTISTPTATSTITDNDAASVVIDDVTVTEDVASGTAVFTVTLTGHIQDALTVDYTTTDGAAINPALQPSDYTTTVGTLTFPAGSNTGATQTITVPIIDNTIAEPTETYTVDLSNIVSTGSASIVDAEGLGTITDDDPVTAINLAGFTITETNGNVFHNFIASIDIAAQEEIVISFTTTNGTAVATDFTAQTAVQYTILPGDLFVNIPIEVLGDLLVEPTESFTGAITLVNANGQQVSIGTDTATGIINDDDTAVISIAGFTVNEAAGTADFTITLNQTIQNVVSVVFGTSNVSATAGLDYTAVSSTTLNFGAANANSQTVTITIADDNITEPTELLNGILSSLVTNGQAITLNGGGAIASAVGTITDNDAVTLTIDDVTEVEVDGVATVNYVFTVTHNGQSTDGPFSVDYTTANIEALAGLDYVAQFGTINFSGTTGETQTITIVVNGDDILEPTETFTVDLSENDFGGRDITFSDDSGLGTITDNDATTVSVVANDATAAEPSNNGQFTVSIGLTSSTPTVISYTISGTATAANDYTTLTGSVTIPAGSTSTTIDVSVLNDNILEASETVIITLDTITSGDADISIGTPVTATVTIADEDSALISILANDATASEPSNNGQFTVSISNASDVDTVISYLITGTATEANDYTTLTGTVTIPAGSTEATIDVTVVDDTILEASETVIVTLNTITSGDTEATIDGVNDVATVTISDNDAASLAIGDITITEGANAVFTVTLSGAVQGGFTIDYVTADGSATIAGNDYTSGSSTLNFTGTDTEFYTVTIATNDDNYLEAVENFVLNLSAISNGLVTYDNQATATLNDNDVASLTVSDITVDEGNNAVFTVTLTGNVQGGVSIDYTTVDNSAIDISDYTAQSGTLNFTGTTPESFTITVPTSEDIIAEPTETYSLDFSSITNALVTYDAQAIGTITDDEVFTISIADTSIAETESAQILNFAVTINGEAQDDVILSFSTTVGTATAASDYITESSVVVTIPAGSTSIDIPVNILGDLILEPTETFTGTITLSNTNGQAISISDAVAIGTITDNDAASIAIADVTVDESAGTATYTVTLTGD
ncbi:MAG: HYR domain-containing protein, partial [Lutibacter sp.]|uniref:HYR domain-containing protein n=1 Tax=Lutibacter sp. TaxID=1925666 RepID=UPI001A0314FD